MGDRPCVDRLGCRKSDVEVAVREYIGTMPQTTAFSTELYMEYRYLSYDMIPCVYHIPIRSNKLNDYYETMFPRAP